MYKICLFSALALICFYSCKTDNAEELYPKPVITVCDTSVMKYGEDIKPIIKKNCLDQGCHTTGNPSAGLVFTEYAGLEAVIPGNRLMKSLRYEHGTVSSKNMPPNYKLDNCDINKIQAWINNGYPEN